MADVVILGSNGMLGSMLEECLSVDHQTLPLNRDKFTVTTNWQAMAWSLNYELLKFGRPDYIINCIGAIKPAFNDPRHNSINNMVNAVFPWLLADFAAEHEAKLIHITTDCVYDGKDGGYVENSPHNPLDAYGKSKSLGEPDNCMVLRTSIIGPERGTQKSLLEWLLANKGGKVNGFTNHMWNGLTTLELSKCINAIIHEDLFQEGTHHVFGTDVNKCDMLRAMSDAWSLCIDVIPTEAREYCNRTLRTTKMLNLILRPIAYVEMIEELREYINDR